MRKSHLTWLLNGFLYVVIIYRLVVHMSCVKVLLAFQASRCFPPKLWNLGFKLWFNRSRKHYTNSLFVHVMAKLGTRMVNTAKCSS